MAVEGPADEEAPEAAPEAAPAATIEQAPEIVPTIIIEQAPEVVPTIIIEQAPEVAPTATNEVATVATNEEATSAKTATNEQDIAAAADAQAIKSAQEAAAKAAKMLAMQAHIPNEIDAQNGKKFLCTINDGSGNAVKMPIAKGGMGMVAKAQDEATKELVAIRIPINQATERKGELEREAHAYEMQGELKGLKPATKEDPRVIMVVELVPGSNLSDQMYKMVRNKEGKEVPERIPLSLEDKKAISYELIRQTYAKFQLRRLVHCDLKGDNMMYDPKSKTIKIVDLGETIDIADHVHEKHKTFKSAGQGYVAPEYRNGAGLQNSFRSDMYSLGVLLAEVWSECEPNYAAQMQVGKDIPEKEMADILDPKKTPTHVPPDILKIIRVLACPDPIHAPVNIAYAVAAANSPELHDISVAQMSLEKTRKQLVEKLADKINVKDKSYIASVDAYNKAMHFDKIADRALPDLADILGKLQVQRFTPNKTDEQKAAKAKIMKVQNSIVDTLIKTLVDAHDIHPEVKEKIIAISKMTSSTPEQLIKKIGELYALKEQNLKDNPPPPLVAMENKDLATIQKHLADYVAKYPKNAASKVIVEEKVITQLNDVCLLQSSLLNQTRNKKINEYPIAVHSIHEKLVFLAQQHLATKEDGARPRAVSFSVQAKQASSTFDSFGAKVDQAARQLKSLEGYPNVSVEKVEKILDNLKEATGATIPVEKKSDNVIDKKSTMDDKIDQGKKIIVDIDAKFSAVKDKGPQAPKTEPERKRALTSLQS